MKLGHPADEIKHETTEGTLSIYAVILEGHHVMSITCDTADTDRVIRIARPHDTGTLETAGRFLLRTDLAEDSDGMPLGTVTTVDEKSVLTYVVPRLHILLGRLLRAS